MLGHKIPPPLQNLEAKTSGWFFGVGIGGGLDRIETQWGRPSSTNGQAHTYYPYSTKNFAILKALVKIGGYQAVHDFASVRYYYSFDFGYNPGHPSQGFRSHTNGFYPYQHDIGFLLLTQTHLLNADLLLDLYKKGDQSFGIVLGMGLGAYVLQHQQRKGNRLFFGGIDGFTLDFAARLNTGLRYAFGKYALELIARIPIITPLSPATGVNPLYDPNRSVSKFKVTPALDLTLDFVMKL